MAPAKRRKGSIMSINKTLKSKLLFISITDSKNSGKIKPIIKINTDKPIAKTIKPIVCGNFNSLKLIIEKKEANNKSMPVSSSTFM